MASSHCSSSAIVCCSRVGRACAIGGCGDHDAKGSGACDTTATGAATGGGAGAGGGCGRGVHGGGGACVTTGAACGTGGSTDDGDGGGDRRPRAPTGGSPGRAGGLGR